MPVKLWNLDEQGNLTSTIRRMGQPGLAAEGFRPQAEELDARTDEILDTAQALLSKQDPNPRRNMFAKRWAIGRAIAASNILDSANLESGERADLCRAMARKCRLGVRHDGTRDTASSWKGLIPEREAEPKRIEDDIFGLGIWLQEQDLEQARSAFGEGLHNAKQIWSREALRSRKFRKALAIYFSERDQGELDIIYRIPQYAILAKTLQQRWPSRGKGSAKRPIHYDDSELLREIQKVLDPKVEEILGKQKQIL